MVKDHHEALTYIIKNKETKISPELIQTINSKVMKSTGNIYKTDLGEIDASKGEFRKGQVFVGSRYFPSYDKVQKLVLELCKDIDTRLNQVNNNTDKLNLSFSAHFNLVSIHPFYDGNGRTSRLLMNLILEKFSLPKCIVFKEDKAEYFESLEESRNTGNLEPFYNFMNEQYMNLLTQEIDLYKKQFKSNDKGSGMSFLF